MLRQFTEEELLWKPLSEEQKRELLALMDERDEDIDTSDIPEVREVPPSTVRGKFHPETSPSWSPFSDADRWGRIVCFEESPP